MKTKHTPGTWLDCGEGTLLHPITKLPIVTRVIEAEGWGRIAEVYDHSNEGRANFALMLAAPELLAELQATESLALELMQRAERIDAKLAELGNAHRDCELGEISRMRAQLSRNRAAISKTHTSASFSYGGES